MRCILQIDVSTDDPMTAEDMRTVFEAVMMVTEAYLMEEKGADVKIHSVTLVEQ